MPVHIVQLGFVLSENPFTVSWRDQEAKRIEKAKRKEKIFKIVMLLGIIFLAVGWAYFWIKGIPTDSSNSWSTLHLIAGLIVALVGAFGWVYYREEWDENFDISSNY